MPEPPDITDASPALSTGIKPINGREPELSGLRRSISPLIVHVDDDTDLLMLVHHVLHVIGGYRVESFRRGTRALDFCQETKPELLITDMYRPGLDGKQLCHAIRTDSDLNDLPIIVFSACLMPALDPVRPYGVTFLRKPCTWQEILTTVDDLIQSDVKMTRARSTF